MYLYNIIPQTNNLRRNRSQFRIPQIFARTESFLNSFFPSTIKEWNNLDISIIQSESIDIFRTALLKFIRPSPNSVFDLNNPIGVQLLSRLRVDLSHLREHKFNHNFRDTINPLCPCNFEIESIPHFFLRCLFFDNERTILMNELLKIDPDIHLFDEISKSNLLLYGNNKYSRETNTMILNLTIEYILNSKRFEVPLL